MMSDALPEQLVVAAVSSAILYRGAVVVRRTKRNRLREVSQPIACTPRVKRPRLSSCEEFQLQCFLIFLVRKSRVACCSGEDS